MFTERVYPCIKFVYFQPSFVFFIGDAFLLFKDWFFSCIRVGLHDSIIFIQFLQCICWYVRKGLANTAPTIKATIPTQATKKDAVATLELLTSIRNTFVRFLL